MRRQYLAWAWLVLGIILTVYGGYSLIYNQVNGKDFSVLGLVFFVVGLVLLILFAVLMIISFVQKKHQTAKKEEVVEETKPVEKETIKVRVEYNDDSASIIPSQTENLVYKFQVEYIQADENALEVSH